MKSSRILRKEVQININPSSEIINGTTTNKIEIRSLITIITRTLAQFNAGEGVAFKTTLSELSISNKIDTKTTSNPTKIETATFFTEITIDTSTSSHINNQISNGTEVAVAVLQKVTRESQMIITKIRQETNGIANPSMSIKINITKIYVQELLKSTGMLNLSMKLTSDLKITELFPIEITKTLT